MMNKVLYIVWGRQDGFPRRASVVVCNIPRRDVTHQGTALGGPAVLRLVRATPCFIYFYSFYSFFQRILITS